MTITWIVYNDSTKQIMGKHQSSALVPPKQPDGFTAEVIPNSEFGDAVANRTSVAMWDDEGKKRTTRAFTKSELDAKLVT